MAQRLALLELSLFLPLLAHLARVDKACVPLTYGRHAHQVSAMVCGLEVLWTILVYLFLNARLSTCHCSRNAGHQDLVTATLLYPMSPSSDTFACKGTQLLPTKKDMNTGLQP